MRQFPSLFFCRRSLEVATGKKEKSKKEKVKVRTKKCETVRFAASFSASGACVVLNCRRAACRAVPSEPIFPPTNLDWTKKNVQCKIIQSVDWTKNEL